jgi:flagellar biosynthesis/type III secretory pathway protein FliH
MDLKYWDVGTPCSFGNQIAGLCQTKQPTRTHANPFALITAAHLQTQQTKHDPEARYQAKGVLVRLLYRQGWDKQRILDLFAVLDWMMRLPEELEQKLWLEIETIEGENKMRYVTSVERHAIKRGMEQGLEQGLKKGKLEGEATILQRLLTKRFGPLPEETQCRLRTATLDQLDLWTERLLDAPTLSTVFDES